MTVEGLGNREMGGLTMGRFAKASFILLQAVFYMEFFLDFGTCSSTPSWSVTTDSTVVRDLNNAQGDSYGRPGLSHLTIAGALLHGLNEVEVWLQTLAPGSGTPVHRHDCEEVFLIVKGEGTLYLVPRSDAPYPGKPREFTIRANSTITIPVNEVHQIRNTNQDKDLQHLAIISRPPIRVFIYKDWQTLHTEAQEQFPYPWDSDLISSAAEECGAPFKGIS